MFRLKLSTKIAILFSIISTIIIFLTGVSYTYFFTKTIESDIESYLYQKTKNIINDHLILNGNTIMFKKGENGETIGTRLRDFDLSGIILDKDNNILETYGIYKNISVEEIYSTLLSNSRLSQVDNSAKPTYEDITISGNRMYDTYTTPLIRDGKSQGVLQLAKEGTFLKLLINTNTQVLMFILPLSILLGSVAGFVVTKMALVPLANLIYAIEHSEASNLSPILKLPVSTSEEIRKLTISFQDLAKRIKDTQLKQKSFLANASHELKTPLTRAVTTIDLVTDESNSLDHQSKITMGNVKDELITLGRVVDEMLSLSQVTTGSDKSIYITPKIIIDKLILELQNEYKDQNICVINELNIRDEILLNPLQFQIIARNILENAFKYNLKNGKIHIKSDTNLVYKLIFTNTAKTIPTNQINEIFDRFKRGLNSAQNAKGFGLGLTIIKDIADLNGLEINIESNDINGTTISVSGFILKT